MGLFSYTIAGSGFLLIGAWESLNSTTTITQSPQRQVQQQEDSNTTNPSSPINATLKPTNPNPKFQSFSSITFISITIFSFLFILNSLISIFNAINSKDRIGSSLQLQVLAIACLFLLYSTLGLVTMFSGSVRFPSAILDLVVLFAFVEEFLLFYLQRKDKDGIENRYFDLMLVPIAICVVSTVVGLKSLSLYARLARGVGLILQGTWFLQMGISFFSDLIVQGCYLREKSSGNFTIRCKGHPEYHRGRGIATLQFNCHLALLVVFLASVYSVVAQNNVDRGDFMRYTPIGSEFQQMESHGHFTLDSDEDEIREVELSGGVEKGAIVEDRVNGYGSH